jgi:DNA repair exonuclease SbcCD ATPase subunit
MSEIARIDAAVARFDQALNRLEMNIAQKTNDAQQIARLAKEAEALQVDRQRMAKDLELIKAKAVELVTTSRQAAGKIDQAMARIRSVLHSNSGA